jgi:hypothetical protein
MDVELSDRFKLTPAEFDTRPAKCEDPMDNGKLGCDKRELRCGLYWNDKSQTGSHESPNCAGAAGPGDGPIDDARHAFYETLTGTFTAPEGTALAGTVIKVSRMGPPAQVGVGANGKNMGDGVGVWFFAEPLVVPPPVDGICGVAAPPTPGDKFPHKQDFNFEIDPLPCVADLA